MHAHVAPILGGVVASLNLHLLNRIHVGLNVCDGDEVIHDGDAIEREAIRNFALTRSDEIFTRRHAGLSRFGSNDDI